MSPSPFAARIPLCQLPAGALGRVCALTGDAEFCQRVRELGFGESAFITKISGTGPFVWVDVAVVDPKSVDYPLAPAQLSCGNAIVIPGAFEITGRDANIVCVRVDTDEIPARIAPVPGTPGTACITLRPE